MPCAWYAPRCTVAGAQDTSVAYSKQLALSFTAISTMRSPVGDRPAAVKADSKITQQTRRHRLQPVRAEGTKSLVIA